MYACVLYVRMCLYVCTSVLMYVRVCVYFHAFVVPLCFVRLVLALLCLVRRTHAYGYEDGASDPSDSADNAEQYSMSCDGSGDSIDVGSRVGSFFASGSSSLLVALTVSIRRFYLRILCSGQVPRFRILGRYRRIQPSEPAEPAEPAELSESTSPPTVPV